MVSSASHLEDVGAGKRCLVNVFKSEIVGGIHYQFVDSSDVNQPER